MDRKQFKSQDRAYRADRAKHQANAFYGTVVAPVSSTNPRGIVAADPLLTLPQARAEHMRLQRADREELTRREFEREEYAALQLDAPRYIRTDDLIRGGMEARTHVYLKACVRRERFPLGILRSRELDLQVVRTFADLRWAA